jgi:hypothetical protein
MKNTTRSLLSTHVPNKGIHLPQQRNLPLTHPSFTQQHKMNQPIIHILPLSNTKHTLKQQHDMVCVCAEIKSPFSERSLREEFRESKIIHCLFPIIDTIIYTITGFNNFLQIRI